MEFETPSGTILAAIVSDGAGSASHAEAGSRMVCAGFMRSAADHFWAGHAFEDIDHDLALDWIDNIRDRINAFSQRHEIRPRDCAATLVALLVGSSSALIFHIGDGAAVLREKGGNDWIVPSWPFQGEYASMTTFVTDDPSPNLSFVSLPIRLDRFAIFSDGIERLVLDHKNHTAHSPFFDRMTDAVGSSALTGHVRSLSKSLRDYLNGASVCERTDDDKSLILGVRL